MQQSKIGSKSTYHRCLKELDNYGYIEYSPSHNPYRGSKIKLTKNWTTSGQVLDKHSPKIGTSTGQALVPKYKHNKTGLNNINSKDKNFKNSNSQSVTSSVSSRAQSRDEMSQNTKSKYSKQNRRACTERSRSITNDALSLSKGMDNLKVSNDKNYNEPL